MSFETYLTVRKEIVEVDEVNRLYKVAEFANPNGKQEDTKMIDRVDCKVKTIIYTDGKITKVIESEPIIIDEYYINGKKYAGEVNQLIKKTLYIENANYILKVVVADEVLKHRKGIGHFDIIEDIEVLFKDKKDKETKKKVKDTLKYISQNPRNSKSVWDALFRGKSNLMNTLEYENVANNIYKLKQKKQTR